MSRFFFGYLLGAGTVFTLCALALGIAVLLSHKKNRRPISKEDSPPKTATKKKQPSEVDHFLEWMRF